jgi:hypothetical protein
VVRDQRVGCLGGHRRTQGRARQGAQIRRALRVGFSVDRPGEYDLREGESQTIVENCGNTLILRCSASAGGGTAQFASRLIGDREIVRTQVSETLSRDGVTFMAGQRKSTTTSLHHATEPAVLPAEIEQLPDLSGYLKLASRPEWVKVRVG